MRHPLVGLAVLALAGCFSPPPQPGPLSFTIPRAPAETLKAAAQALVADGFEIEQRDAETGILVARRVGGSQRMAGYIRCAHDPSSAAANSLRATLTVTVRAQPASSGTATTIESRVLSQFTGTSYGGFQMSDSDTHCASTGRAEQALVSALREDAVQ